MKPGKNKDHISVSVIIAARNEEANIGLCLDALVKQSYPKKMYDITVVNDRSNDGTGDIVKEYAKKYSNIKSLKINEIPDGFSPKKNALANGIAQARGEIILTTDADCAPVPTWIETMVSYFDSDVGLVAGFSPLEKTDRETLFSKMMTLDSLSLAAIAAGSFGIAKPLTCNGRNLAYRKKAYDEVGGFDKIKHFVSGDDDLFLHLITGHTSWKTKYAFDKNALVKSTVPENAGHFASQRTRHASKGFFYSTWLTLSLAAVYLFNLLLVILLPVSIVHPNFLFIWGTGFFLKITSEFIFLFKVASAYHYQRIFTAYPVAALLHPLYVIVFGLWGQVGKFKWKE